MTKIYLDDLPLAVYESGKIYSSMIINLYIDVRYCTSYVFLKDWN